MHLHLATPPTPDGDARGGDTPGTNGDRLAVRCDLRSAVLGDLDVPAFVWGLAGNRNVTAEADEDARAMRDSEGGLGREIGGKRFRGGAQIDLDPGIDLDAPAC